MDRRAGQVGEILFMPSQKKIGPPFGNLHCKRINFVTTVYITKTQVRIPQKGTKERNIIAHLLQYPNATANNIVLL